MEGYPDGRPSLDQIRLSEGLEVHRGHKTVSGDHDHLLDVVGMLGLTAFDFVTVELLPGWHDLVEHLTVEGTSQMVQHSCKINPKEIISLY